MSDQNQGSLDRRDFLQAGALTAVAAGLTSGGRPAAAAPGPQEQHGKARSVLPRRVLGKTGAEVTILTQGTVGQPAALERLLRYAYREGVRYFDTAEGYRNAEVV